jgi:hypothetical protein
MKNISINGMWENFNAKLEMQLKTRNLCIIKSFQTTFGPHNDRIHP